MGDVQALGKSESLVDRETLASSRRRRNRPVWRWVCSTQSWICYMR